MSTNVSSVLKHFGFGYGKNDVEYDYFPVKDHNLDSDLVSDSESSEMYNTATEQQESQSQTYMSVVSSLPSPCVLEHLGYDENEFEMGLDLSNDIVLKGRIQEGKTNFCMNMALRAMYEQDKHVIMVVDNYTTMKELSIWF